MLAVQFTGAGFTFLAELGSMTALGWWLDGRWGSAPWLMCLGAALGMTVALYHLLRAASAFEAASRKDESESRALDEQDGSGNG